jgi:hypothetical protein
MTRVLMCQPRRSITLIWITVARGISRVTNPLQHANVHGEALDGGCAVNVPGPDRLPVLRGNTMGSDVCPAIGRRGTRAALSLR